MTRYFVIALCFVTWSALLSADPVLESPPIQMGFYDNAVSSKLVELIDTAQSTLYIEIYEMDDPDVLAAIRRAIKDRSVEVKVVKEPNPVGESCLVFDTDRPIGHSVYNCPDQQKLKEDILQAGGQYVAFNKPTLCGGNGKGECVEHGKIVIIDEKIALVSSGNFNTSNLCNLKYNPETCNRDYSYITDVPAIVATLVGVFKKDLEAVRYDLNSVIDAEAQTRLTISPNSLQPLIQFIASANSRIQIQNQYLKEPNINNALIEAAKRGVKVEVNVASVCAFEKPTGNEAQELSTIFDNFEKAGIAVKMFTKNQLVNGRPGYLHAKAIVLDGKRAWMGSVNGSTEAVSVNREFGIFFNEAEGVQRLSSRMEQDFNDANAETWQQSLDCAENSVHLSSQATHTAHETPKIPTIKPARRQHVAAHGGEL